MGIKSIAAGTGGHVLALQEIGTVWVWGQTCCGAAGNGLDADSPSDPEFMHLVSTQVRSLSQVVAISAGENHHMALGADGTVWTWWGLGDAGQNGTGLRHPESFASLEDKRREGSYRASPGKMRFFGLRPQNDIWCHPERSEGSDPRKSTQ
jgi:alpha-tubulin suppressor-like RCC1 family protein